MSRVAVERCAACGHVAIEPRGFCPRCGSRDVLTDTISGAGAIWSLTEIHRPPSSGDAAGPYTVGIVALSAGPRLMARLPDGLAIGDRVTVSRDTLDGVPTVISDPKG